MGRLARRPGSARSRAAPLEPPLDPRAEPFVAVIKAAGAEPVIEWGVLSGEVLGLEVAGLHDPDGAWLEIGIGKHGRLGHRLLWRDQPPVEALSQVVEAALGARRSGDRANPLTKGVYFLATLTM